MRKPRDDVKKKVMILKKRRVSVTSLQEYHAHIKG